MKKILYFLILTILLGCNTNDDIKCLSYYVGTSVRFQVLDDEGKDMLDPKTPNHFDTSKIRIFYLLNNVKHEFYKGHLTNSRGYMIYEPENEKASRIAIHLNTEDKSKKTTTYVQWNEKITDTIEATFEITDCYIKRNKVWYNGKLIWDTTEDEGHNLIIRK